MTSQDNIPARTVCTCESCQQASWPQRYSPLNSARQADETDEEYATRMRAVPRDC